MTEPSADATMVEPIEEQGDEIFAKDPVEIIENEVREAIVSQGRTTIMKLAESLSEKNAARVLRMIETISEHHREMIASLGLGDDILRRKKKKNVLGLSGDPLSLYESGVGGGYESGETFGAQAIQQIGSALTGAVGTANEGKAIQQLTSALAEAKEAKLDSVVPAIEAKLRKTLGVTDTETASAAPTPVPGNGAGAVEGGVT